MLKTVKNLFDPYILMMLAVVGIATLFPAHGRGAVGAGIAAGAGIVFLFFLYGTRLSPEAAISGFVQWRLQIAVIASTFGLFPALGLGLAALVHGFVPPLIASGILYLCVLPSTVQSSIAFTSIARGNVPAAVCAASASNILGVVVSPILAAWLLQTQHAQLSFGVITDIVLQLLLPFAVGQVLRPWIGAWIQQHRSVLGYADRGSILLIIYVAFSKSITDDIWHRLNVSDLVVLFALLLILLLIALAITGFLGRRLLRMSVEDEIVLQFCGSKKSLASGLPMATIIFSGPQLGMIVLPLMIFHQLQLIICAILARHYATRPT
jgi:sodium/bile acid cotransporter 7